MTVAKVIEVSAESSQSFEDAIRTGIQRATDSVHGVRGAWVKEQKVVVERSLAELTEIDLVVSVLVHVGKYLNNLVLLEVYEASYSAHLFL